MKKEVNYLNILTNVLLGRNSKITNAIGYIDTGNSLRCSVTGRHVAIATYEVAADLISTDLIPLLEMYRKDPFSMYMHQDKLPFGFYLIPYKTICADDQIMLAMDADYMFVDNRYVERKPLVGISPTSFKVLHTNKCILLNKNYMKRGKRHVKHHKGK